MIELRIHYRNSEEQAAMRDDLNKALRKTLAGWKPFIDYEVAVCGPMAFDPEPITHLMIGPAPTEKDEAVAILDVKAEDLKCCISRQVPPEDYPIPNLYDTEGSKTIATKENDIWNDVLTVMAMVTESYRSQRLPNITKATSGNVTFDSIAYSPAMSRRSIYRSVNGCATISGTYHLNDCAEVSASFSTDMTFREAIEFAKTVGLELVQRKTIDSDEHYPENEVSPVLSTIASIFNELDRLTEQLHLDPDHIGHLAAEIKRKESDPDD